MNMNIHNRTPSKKSMFDKIGPFDSRSASWYEFQLFPLHLLHVASWPCYPLTCWLGCVPGGTVHALDGEVDRGEREPGGARGRGVPPAGGVRGAAPPQQLQRGARRRGRLRLRLRAPPQGHLPGTPPLTRTPSPDRLSV